MKNGLFDPDTLTVLCDILDKSQGWLNLAELLDYGFLVASIRDSASPSKMLFNYADVSMLVQNLNFLNGSYMCKYIAVVTLASVKFRIPFRLTIHICVCQEIVYILSHHNKIVEFLTTQHKAESV